MLVLHTQLRTYFVCASGHLILAVPGLGSVDPNEVDYTLTEKGVGRRSSRLGKHLRGRR
jgi:hypothetical protein